MDETFVICWEVNGQKVWEKVTGNSAMQDFVDDKCFTLNIDSDDIFVFPVTANV